MIQINFLVKIFILAFQIPVMNKTDAVLTKLIEKNKTPSVHYVIFNKDSVIHAFTAGYANIKNLRKVEGNTTYHAYSVTKIFTALAVLQLADKKPIFWVFSQCDPLKTIVRLSEDEAWCVGIFSL